MKTYDEKNGKFGEDAEAWVRDFVTRSGYEAIRHPDGKYGPDIEFISDRESFHISVERRTMSGWCDGKAFPFPTVSFLNRRKIVQGTIYFVVSRDMNDALAYFPEDLDTLPPVEFSNRYSSREFRRELEVMRCLPLDLTGEIDGSIALMNARRVRRIVEEESDDAATRALTGKYPDAFGPPYGMTAEEWRDLVIRLERRKGGLMDEIEKVGASGGEVQQRFF
jgi:hypothetical protein